MVTNLNNWKAYFHSIGVATKNIPNNDSVIQLSNISGGPLFKVANTVEELNDLHIKARDKSSELSLLFAVALPLDHPATLVSLPGDIVLPKIRVYAGRIGDTFSLHSHSIECEFLKSIKREVLSVIRNGQEIRTPLCDWIQKLLGTSWIYGTPTSLTQLDTMLGLLQNSVDLIGHIRSRQLSYGRGCGDALLLPMKGLVLNNNKLDQSIDVADYRLISLETELTNYDASRARIYPTLTDKYLNVLSVVNPQIAEDLNSGTFIGGSKIGNVVKAPTTVQKVKVKIESQPTVTVPV